MSKRYPLLVRDSVNTGVRLSIVPACGAHGAKVIVRSRVDAEASSKAPGMRMLESTAKPYSDCKDARSAALAVGTAVTPGVARHVERQFTDVAVDDQLRRLIRLFLRPVHFSHELYACEPNAQADGEAEEIRMERGPPAIENRLDHAISHHIRLQRSDGRDAHRQLIR